jgi:hypothetical protein
MNLNGCRNPSSTVNESESDGGHICANGGKEEFAVECAQDLLVTRRLHITRHESSNGEFGV